MLGHSAPVRSNAAPPAAAAAAATAKPASRPTAAQLFAERIRTAYEHAGELTTSSRRYARAHQAPSSTRPRAARGEAAASSAAPVRREVKRNKYFSAEAKAERAQRQAALDAAQRRAAVRASVTRANGDALAAHPKHGEEGSTNGSHTGSDDVVAGHTAEPGARCGACERNSECLRAVSQMARSGNLEAAITFLFAICAELMLRECACAHLHHHPRESQIGSSHGEATEGDDFARPAILAVVILAVMTCTTSDRTCGDERVAAEHAAAVPVEIAAALRGCERVAMLRSLDVWLQVGESAHCASRGTPRYHGLCPALHYAALRRSRNPRDSSLASSHGELTEGDDMQPAAAGAGDVAVAGAAARGPAPPAAPEPRDPARHHVPPPPAAAQAAARAADREERRLDGAIRGAIGLPGLVAAGVAARIADPQAARGARDAARELDAERAEKLKAIKEAPKPARAAMPRSGSWWTRGTSAYGLLAREHVPPSCLNPAMPEASFLRSYVLLTLFAASAIIMNACSFFPDKVPDVLAAAHDNSLPGITVAVFFALTAASVWVDSRTGDRSIFDRPIGTFYRWDVAMSDNREEGEEEVRSYIHRTDALRARGLITRLKIQRTKVYCYEWHDAAEEAGTTTVYDGRVELHALLATYITFTGDDEQSYRQFLKAWCSQASANRQMNLNVATRAELHGALMQAAVALSAPFIDRTLENGKAGNASPTF